MRLRAATSLPWIVFCADVREFLLQPRRSHWVLTSYLCGQPDSFSDTPRGVVASSLPGHHARADTASKITLPSTSCFQSAHELGAHAHPHTTCNHQEDTRASMFASSGCATERRKQLCTSFVWCVSKTSFRSDFKHLLVCGKTEIGLHEALQWVVLQLSHCHAIAEPLTDKRLCVPFL